MHKNVRGADFDCCVAFDKRNARSTSNNALMHFFWDRNRKTNFQTERSNL